MKSYIAFILIALTCLTINSTANAQNWIPYQGFQPQTIQINNYPVYFPPVPQSFVVYQWTPYVVQQTTVVEHRRLFCKTQQIVTEPVVQWFYVPTIVNK